MKKVFLIILFALFTTSVGAQNKDKAQIDSTLDNWHKAATEANFVNYFELPLHNEYGYLIKAKKNITKSEYVNKTTYSIFQTMTAKPIEDSEFEPE